MHALYIKRTKLRSLLGHVPSVSINKAAWGAKLILTADVAFPVSCASLGHLLIAQDSPL